MHYPVKLTNGLNTEKVFKLLSSFVFSIALPGVISFINIGNKDKLIPELIPKINFPINNNSIFYILIDIRQINIAIIAITSSMIRSFLLPFLFAIFIRTIIAPIIPPIGDIDYNSL